MYFNILTVILFGRSSVVHHYIILRLTFPTLSTTLGDRCTSIAFCSVFVNK